MDTLLIVNSSPRSTSVSRRLTEHVAKQWLESNPEGRVIRRDLAAEPLPYVTEPWIQASYTPAPQLSPEQQQTLALSDQLIEELHAADLIVLGVPMHNFSIPASLKAWIDLIVRAGRTFKYGEKGAQGLLASNKRVLIIVSRGGSYGQDSPSVAADFQVPYLKHMLAFIGLTHVTVVDADKQAFGAEAARQSTDEALRQLSKLAEHCNEDVPAVA